ncbi:hypothetical protein Taro_019238 [Colocasia esculenta]|uniref:Glabrous enhancer-binding protein-like DBD domain-containing protein n=1 Tax=Colocasia esculenta TaxID=4460 RepID=A0A843USW9_COLES|nr:hypothetical protein [Colocasia esculenta]
MPSPAAGAPGRRPRTFVADGDDVEDSDEETVDEAFDDEEEEVDDSGKHPQRRKPWVVVASSSSSAAAARALAEAPNEHSVLSASSAVPNLNGGSGAVDAAAAGEEGGGGYATPRRKRRRTGAEGSAEGRTPLGALEDSRRMFQRLWTDEDEIAILQGFLDFSSGRRRAAVAAHHHDTGPFYDQIRARLRLDFNKSQLVEKLRRLKKKYRNVTGKMSSGKDHAFRSPHDQATFELSRQIWGNAIYSRGGGGDEVDVDDLAPHQVGDLEGGGVVAVSEPRKPRRRSRKRSVAEAAVTPAAGAVVLAAGSAPVEVKISESHTSPKAMAPVPNVIQETVRSCLSPMFKELLCWAVGGRMGGGAVAGGILEGLTLSLLPLGVGSNHVKLEGAPMADEKWRKQQIMELEVFSKRMELVQEQIKLILRELR